MDNGNIITYVYIYKIMRQIELLNPEIGKIASE